MEVLLLTVLLSLVLAGVFVTLFLKDRRTKRISGAERDSLLPFADESSRDAQ